MADIPNSMVEFLKQYNVDEIMEATEECIKLFKESATPIDGLNLIRQIIDSNIASTPKEVSNKFSCKAGCAHCCHIQVVTTKIEAEDIVNYCSNNGIEIDTERLEKQKDIPDEHAYMFSPHKKCVFLGTDNLCKIYPVRPLVCRTHYVTSPAQDCDTDSNASGRVLEYVNIHNLPPQMSLEMVSGYDLFSKLLLNALKIKANGNH